MDQLNCNITELAKLFDDLAPEPEETQIQFEQQVEPKESDCFWNPDEITPVGFYATDDRPEPEYELKYRQNVGTGDVYFLMSLTDPSISSCDTAIFEVKLPDTRPDDIDVNVLSGYVDLRTPKYRLIKKLNYPTVDDKTTAKLTDGVLTLEIPLKKMELKIV